MALLESQLMNKKNPLIDFSLKNYNGVFIDSKSFQNKNLLLIVFTCNHCPYAMAAWEILLNLQNKFENDGLQIIAINPNNNPDYPDDKFSEMSVCHKKYKLNFPYLIDEDQKIAKAYNAVCTPDPFLFSRSENKFSLFYHGRLNDNWKEPSNVKENSMELFILAALNKGLEPKKIFPSMGCSIKWVL